MTKSFFIVFAFCIVFIQDIYTQQNNSTTAKTVKIGLLIDNNNAIAARNGAEMAIDIENKKQGPDGLHFQLITKSMEGPWGTGSKEVVNLVFNENVWALMGSHDARNAHLAEQVIAKTHIVYLSAWASDPTLSQAFVPWYFSCVPNDIQQADAMIEEIYNKRTNMKTAIVSDNSDDSKLPQQNFLKEIKRTGKTEPMQLLYDNSNNNFKICLDKINDAGIQGIILLGQPETNLNFIKQIRQNKMNQPIYGSLALLGGNDFDDGELIKFNNVKLVTYGNWLGSKDLSFQNTYHKKYGKIPGAAAAYAFDGMNLIIEAIKHSGPNREKVQEAMAEINYKGVTGPIQFDQKGNRMGTVRLINITDELKEK